MTQTATAPDAPAGDVPPNTGKGSPQRKKKAKVRHKFDLLSVIKLGLYGFFILFLVIPVASLIIVAFTEEPVNIFGSFVDGDIRQRNIDALAGASVQNFTEALTSPRYARSLMNSLLLSTGVALGTVLLSMPIAYGFARFRMPAKKSLMVLTTIPIVVPSMVAASGFIAMFGRSGWMSSIFETIGLPRNLIDPYTMGGLVILLILFLFPFVLWPMVAAFKIADSSLENAAENLGARSFATFFTVTLPLALPGIISASLLIFAIAFSDFGAAIILAPDGLNLIVVEAYREISGFFNWAGASVLVIVMIAVAAAFFGLQRLAVRNRNYGTLTQKGAKIELKTGRKAGWTLTIYTAVVVTLPTLVLASVIVQSFAGSWSNSLLPGSWTLSHYDRAFSRNIDNLWNSLTLAGGALLVALIACVFIAYFVQRDKAGALDFIATVPLVIPGIALGIALIQTFNSAPLALTGTAFILIVAYAIRRLPYMLRTASGSMQAIGGEVEEAAQNLGASRTIALGTVVFPLLAPALLAGSILVFVTVIKETSITVLMASSTWQPLSYSIFQSLYRGEVGSAAALSTILIVVVIILQQVAYKVVPGGIDGETFKTKK